MFRYRFYQTRVFSHCSVPHVHRRLTLTPSTVLSSVDDTRLQLTTVFDPYIIHDGERIQSPRQCFAAHQGKWPQRIVPERVTSPPPAVSPVPATVMSWGRTFNKTMLSVSARHVQPSGSASRPVPRNSRPF
jgi:hypothetical protein